MILLINVWEQEQNGNYELVGVIDARKTKLPKTEIIVGGGHFWAWIKDEFDSKRPWYFRDDANPSVVKPQNFNPKSLTCPVFSLYKKVVKSGQQKSVEESNKDILRLAQGLNALIRG